MGLSILVGFSRLVLGAHSMNQVLFGWLIGGWIYFFWKDIIQPYIKKVV